MQRHPVDPVSAALGLLAVAAGVLVAAGAFADIDDRGAWWLVVAAVVLGVAIVPWRWRTAPAEAPVPPDVAESAADEVSAPDEPSAPEVGE
jgi:hypothetical protein